MKARVFLLCLSGALAAPVSAYAEEPSKAAGELSCGQEGAPGWACYDKGRLWAIGDRFRSKLRGCQDDLADEETEHTATRKKLRDRSPDAISRLVVTSTPTEAPSADSVGSSTVLWVVSIGAALLAGGIVGALVTSKDEPQTIVVK